MQQISVAQLIIELQALNPTSLSPSVKFQSHFGLPWLVAAMLSRLQHSEAVYIHLSAPKTGVAVFVDTF